MNNKPRRRSRLWWYLRMRRAYRLHGVLKHGYSRKRTWEDAQFGRRLMDPERQWTLGPIKGPRG